MKLKNLIFYLLIFLVGFLGLKFLFSHHLSYSNTGLKNVLDNKKADILIIGSSHVRFSYDILLIESQCQCSVRAISYSFLNPTIIKEILHVLSDYKKLPRKKLIVDHYSLLFHLEKEFIDTRLFSDSPLKLKVFLAKYLFENFTSLKFYDYYRFFVLAENERLLNFLIDKPIVDDRNYNGGYLKKNIHGVSKEKYDTLNISSNVYDFENFNKLEYRSIVDIHKIFARRDFELVFVETPLPIPVYQDQRVQSTIKKLKSMYGDGPNYFDSNIYFEKMKLNHSHFMDENHLSTLGRESFSLFISEEIIKN